MMTKAERRIVREKEIKSVILTVAFDRLRTLKENYDAERNKRAAADGLDWAARLATYVELDRLASRYHGGDDFDDDEGTPPETFLMLISEEGNGDEIDDEDGWNFWDKLNKRSQDPDKHDTSLNNS